MDGVLTMPSQERLGKNQITLARALSKLGIASRKQAAALILAGRVDVRGKTIRSPNVWIDPKQDRITVDGKALRQRPPVYLVMNKPAGVVTTRSDELGRKTVYDLLPGETRWLFPVGRLDKDTSGLLLFTNDTRLGDTVTNPLTKLPKTYTVDVDKPLRPGDKKLMESTFVLNDGTVLKPAKVIVGNTLHSFRMTIIEGKNRQIRRMCEELGYEVRSLHRVSIGPIRLGMLKEGEVRPLTEKELSEISFVRIP
ncbi:MAG: ribosomal large subunit pseudouridine synthase [Bacteroidetes bacterium]|nr:ribosomal large subunit pseudouridine synthase [Bacteroidota bacterium]